MKSKRRKVIKLGMQGVARVRHTPDAFNVSELVFFVHLVDQVLGHAHELAGLFDVIRSVEAIVPLAVQQCELVVVRISDVALAAIDLT